LNRRGRPRVLRGAAQELLVAAAVEHWKLRWKPLRDGNKRGRVGAYRQVAENLLHGALGPDAVEKVYKRWHHQVAKCTRAELSEKAAALRKMFAPTRQDRRLPGYFGGDRPAESPRHARHIADFGEWTSKLKAETRAISDVEFILHAVKAFELDEEGIIRLLKRLRPTDDSSLLAALKLSDYPVLVKAFRR
jgi:hypothetical protein